VDGSLEKFKSRRMRVAVLQITGWGFSLLSRFHGKGAGVRGVWDVVLVFLRRTGDWW